MENKDKVSKNKPKSTDDEEIEVRRKGILRRVAIDDESERFDSEPIPSTCSNKSPENGDARPALKSYSFSFFKSKERKDVRTEGKGKARLGDSTSLKSKDSDKSEASTPSLSVEPSDSWRKKGSGSGNKQTSFDEKSKTFIKQKSKDNSGEPVRKNSINFGHLREKYNRWSKSCRNDGGKAASAETLEQDLAGGQREGYVQGEFLAASMRIFLVVSPPASRTQVRSRSLNNLDSLENKNNRLIESRLKSKMFFGTKTCIPGYFTSLPELTALNFTKGLPYKPGVTHGKSAFVRRNTAKLKHTNSQGSTRDYFRLSLPSSFEFTESIEDKSPDKKKNSPNSIFVPAVGNTSLRDAAQWALESERLKQNQIITDFSIRIDGSSQYLQLESVDAGQLAGRHVILHDTRKLRNLFRKSSIGLKSSSKLSSPASSKSFHDPKTPLALKLQKWSSIFGSKADAVVMEKLMVKLDQMNYVRPKLPPNLRPLSLPEASQRLMISIQNMTLEDIMDPDDFDDQKELRRQRIIFELISTEAAYICNIRTIVELFLAVALALQKENILVEIDTDKIFLNLPEILNINLHFWNETLYPMLAEAGVKRFNHQALYDTFHNFRGIFHPYSEYVEAQGRIQVYTRQLVETNPIYTAYLTWCESQKECNRLKLSDLLVKPMQRLTKYSLLLKAIDLETDPGIDKVTLKTIILNCTKYISSVDRKIRYVQELDIMDALIENIESYDVVDSKDEDVEKVVRLHCDLNLKTKFPYYEPRFHRTVILQGELKFKDKEQKIEIRAVLLTDIFLVCSIGNRRKKTHSIKIIRPKILMNRVYLYPQYVLKDGVKELNFLIAVVVDETDVAISYFCLYEPSSPKESTNPTIKQWLFALRESQTTLSLTKKMLEDGRIHMYDLDPQSESDADKRGTTQEVILEPMEAMQPAVNKAAIKRIGTMVYGANLPIEQYPPEGVEIRDDFTRPCSSRASRMSSLHQSYSGSYDTYEAGTSGQAVGGTRAGSADTSTDHRTISMSSDEGQPTPILTSEQVQQAVEAATSKLSATSLGRPRGVLRAPPTCPPRIPTAMPTPNTLSVHTSHANLGQSMPDLASGQISPAHTSYSQTPNKVCLNVPPRTKYLKPSSGKSSKSSEKLSPESRGISYPPSSPTRASLRRGMAFSNTIKNPPLVKSRNISRDSSPCIPPPPNSQNPSPCRVPPSSPASCQPSTSTGYTGNEYLGHFLTIPHSSDGSEPPSTSHQSTSDV